MKILLIFLFLVGCGLPTMTKPDLNQQQFAKDHYACFRDAQWTNSGVVGYQGGAVGGSQRNTDHRIYQMCMEARGYHKQ